MKTLWIGLLALSLNAHATCMQTCADADAGDDPQAFGVVTVTTSCSAPGGPLQSTVQHYFDECTGGVQTEYGCDAAGAPNAQSAYKKNYACKRCDPSRRGVCLRIGRATLPVAAGTATQSCTTL